LSTLEIILPLRNPPAVFSKTVESLAAQTDRRFSVLISDNGSTQGLELIDDAVSRLTKSGIQTRRVKPAAELGRVEHWNWAHHESGGAWLKPLFAGDWLEPNYVEAIHEAWEDHPECRYIFCNYVLHPGENPPVKVESPWAGAFRRPDEMREMVLRYGMQFGPPSAAAFEKTAFVSMGGYPTPLPICSDSVMFCTIAARYGVLGLAPALCHFNIHGARFSTTLPQKRRDTFRETMTYYAMLASLARADGGSFPWNGFARLMLREWRAYRRGG
jgi:hypothetical protein